MTAAERSRRYRANKGAGSKPGRRITQPCPSPAAFRRHKRNGEEPCAGCRDKYNEAARKRYAEIKQSNEAARKRYKEKKQP